MKAINLHGSSCFYGQKVSDFGMKNGYIDYHCLASSFNAVLANGLIESTAEVGYWEQVHGFIDHSEEIAALEDQLLEADGDDEISIYEKIDELQEEQDYQPEVFQWFIIDRSGVDTLTYWTDEIIYYNDELDLYLWGVTHWGTSWDYVLTDIAIA